VEQGQKTEAEKSFRCSSKEGYAISKVTTSVVKTKSGKYDVIYQFFFSKITESSEKQKAVKKRVTKFVKSSEFSSISCSGQESLTGVLSDYDEKLGRIYALECSDSSNTKEEKEEKVTETVSLKEGISKSIQAKSSKQVVKSIKIVSITSTTITYEITYCSYSYTKESRFSSSSTTEEYKSQSSSSSSKSGKKSGSKSKGKKGSGSGKKKGSGSGGKKKGSGSGKKGSGSGKKGSGQKKQG